MLKGRLLAKNAILNTLRQFGAVVFPLVTFPYVSRVLQVENYGKYTFSNSIVNYFCMIAALGITNYAIREGSGLREQHSKLQKFANEVFTINIITMIISYLLLILLLIVWPRMYDYRLLIIIQSVTIFSNTIGVEWLYSIFEDYTYVTIRSLTVQFVALVLMFIFVRERGDYVKYALITVLAAGGGNVFGFIYSKKFIQLRLTRTPRFSKHLLPMFVLFFNAVAVTIYANSDITLLGIFKGNHTVGLYNVAVRIYTIAKQLLNATVIVILPRVSFYIKERRMREYTRLIKQVSALLIALILPATVGLVVLSPQIIQLIAGDAYLGGSRSLQILTIAIMFSIFASLITTGVLLPYKREKKILTATIWGAMLNIFLNLIMIPLLSLNGAAFTTLLAESLVFILSLYFARDLYNFKVIIPPFIRTAIASIPVAVCCLLSKLYFTNTLLIIFVSIIGSIVTYAVAQAALILIQNRLKSGLRHKS